MNIFLKIHEYKFSRNKNDVGLWHYIESGELYPEIVAEGKGLEIEVTLSEQSNLMHLGTFTIYKIFNTNSFLSS